MSNEAPETRLAIMLKDIDSLPEQARMILKGRLDLYKLIRILGESSAVFSCSLKEACLACDMVRNDDRINSRVVTSIWINKGTYSSQGWRRVSSNALLTVVLDGKIQLNPAVFSTVLIAPSIQATPIRVGSNAKDTNPAS